MRASRLLSILLLLHTRGRVSAQQLADELEVTVRTVYRDIDALGAAGIPVHATRGRTGGFQLLAGFRTRLTGLTANEADALFLAGLPVAAQELGLGPVLAASQLKLLASLPPPLRERAERVRDRFHLDAPGWERSPDSPACLAIVADAVWQQQRIEVRYRRSNRAVVDRVLEPLGLVLKAGVWYAVARATDAGGTPRTYRLSRVLTATPLEQTFERPVPFDLAAHWADYQRDYESRLFRSLATIRLTERGRTMLFLVGAVAARAGHAAMHPVDADGWSTTTIPVESVQHALHALLQLGGDVEVLEPPELRAAVIDAAQAVLARYTGSVGGVSAGRAGGSG